MSSSSKAYQFTISGNAVTAVYKVEGGRVKLEHMDSDETWTFDGSNVVKTEMSDGRLETTTYADVDGDGLFFKTGKTYSGTGLKSDGDDDLSHSGGSSLIPNTSAYSEEGLQFALDANGVVTAVSEVKYGYLEADTMGPNETWLASGQDVIKIETKLGQVEACLYSDANQDGVFQKSFGLEVLTGTNPLSLETYKFTLADGTKATGDVVVAGDAIGGAMELGKRGWKVDHIDANETFQVVEIGSDNLLLKTSTQKSGEIDFSVFRDDDNDGLWTKIVEGETRGTFMTQDGQVNLVGMADAGLLQLADALIA